jgi:hypothetical protein
MNKKLNLINNKNGDERGKENKTGDNNKMGNKKYFLEGFDDEFIK